MASRKIFYKKTFWLVGVAIAAAIGLYGWFGQKSREQPALKKSEPVSLQARLADASFSEVLQLADQTPPKPPPPPVDLKRLKAQGCVADGLLTEYNPENNKFVELINRSNCYYLHRAIETWREPPDFERIELIMESIAKPEVVYGMFIAEAIQTNVDYENEETGHMFDFKEMCHRDGMYDWGEHTCTPTFSSQEYRDYIKYTTRRAIDLGVQSFTFGQIYMQESEKRDFAPEIVKDIRSYAKKKGVDVVIGAQTGLITDAEYIKLFDYIEGGVGIDANGNIENGPCLSRRGSCWALLWHKSFSKNAKNVLLHLDWTGIKSDDLDIFARMDATTRTRTLKNLYSYFNSRDMGFLMPYFGVLHTENGGCYGPKKRFYSPDNAYSCQDENAINQILAK